MCGITNLMAEGMGRNMEIGFHVHTAEKRIARMPYGKTLNEGEWVGIGLKSEGMGWVAEGDHAIEIDN